MRSRADETVAVVATPRATGAIAVVEVLGPRAFDAVSRFARPAPGLVRACIVDDVLLRFRRRVATGEPCVEVSCHGNPHAVRVVIAALGVREVDRAFVLDRAVANRRLDRTRAEAMLLLPGALTTRGARMLADQAAGALARAARRLRRPDTLAATAAVGCALAAPRRVAIVGRPNAGKSTLFNAIVERDRALVSPQAHTTRDPVAETIAIDGMPLVLVDTAGLAPGGAIEALSAERTALEVSRADLVIRLDDTPVPARRVLQVHPKTDLVPAPRATLGVCAPKGEGLDRLRRAILRALDVDVRTRPGAPVVFTERQRRALEDRRWRDGLLWG